MRALDLGLGARQVLAGPAGGRVVAAYRRAAYLRLPVGLVAVTTERAPPGPLHLRCPVLPPLRVGDPVRTDGTHLHGPAWSVSLAAPTWVGALPKDQALAAAARKWPVSKDIARRAPSRSPWRLAERLRAGDLRAVAAVLGGRGPGLTPAGDDVLSGVLLVARALWGETAEPELAAVAAGVRTTDIASAFLAWSARGQSIQPAHDVLTAVAAGQDMQAAGAVRMLSTFGQSSGLALVTGLRLSLDRLPRTQPPHTEIHTARAGRRPGLVKRCGRSVG